MVCLLIFISKGKLYVKCHKDVEQTKTIYVNHFSNLIRDTIHLFYYYLYILTRGEDPF